MARKWGQFCSANGEGALAVRLYAPPPATAPRYVTDTVLDLPVPGPRRPLSSSSFSNSRSNSRSSSRNNSNNNNSSSSSSSSSAHSAAARRRTRGRGLTTSRPVCWPVSCPSARQQTRAQRSR